MNEKYKLSDIQIKHFKEKGWINLNGVLEKQQVENYRLAITNTVKKNSENVAPLEERDTYDQAFLQVHNLWTQNETVKEFVLAPRFAKIAAELLGVERVRLYHDQALYKEPGGGKTPWHQDQYYWPIDSRNTVTMWMPLVDLTEEMGILQFASGTHKSDSFERMAISDKSEEHFSDLIKSNETPTSSIKTYKAGDASFHYGWTLHYAPGNFSTKMREVMTIIYVADNAKVIEPQHDAHRFDLAHWMPGLKVGDKINSELNPII